MNDCIYMGVFAFIDERHMVSHLGIITKDNTIYEGSMTGGYKSACINGKPVFVHRLVGKYFVPNPQNKATINHKRGIKTDNRASELEWATYSENNLHALAFGLKPKTTAIQQQMLVKRNKDAARNIIRISDGKKYISARDAAKDKENKIGKSWIYKQMKEGTCKLFKYA